MSFVFEGRVKDLCCECGSNATYNKVSFEVYTSFSKRGVKQYFAYEKANSSAIDLFGDKNEVEFEIDNTTPLFNFISVHYRDRLEIEYEKGKPDEVETKEVGTPIIRIIKKVMLIND